ncbi:D-amino acid dehydrogenase [Bartonella choladocola]|uniref:D-amino-acid dehydrogenase n=1 Tax=Bartonella choladocola TaxID=2750995 RepID=A0A1U9MFN0_9HYPH|nr:D-amino acid dehydrogenase [Bartonella choladocola]AQT46543.1 D-amino-acid dehydrogenase [Bartonella choladocola]
MERHVVVIGGGVIGLTTAYALIKQGQKVTLVERMDDVGLVTSFANGGQLSYRYVSPLADAGVPMHVFKWIGKPRSPLNLKLRFSLDQWKWLFQFLLACNAKTNKINGAHILRLSLFSQKIVTQWRESGELGNFDWVKTGKLVIYRDLNDFNKAKAGINKEFQKALTAKESVELEPSLGFIENKLAGSIFSPGDETADCYKFCCVLLEALKKHPNFTLKTSTHIDHIITQKDRITGVETNSGSVTGDDYVICTGNSSKHILARIGISVPIYPLKGYSLTLPYPEKPHIVPAISLTDYSNKILYAKLGDRLRLACMVDIGYEDAGIRQSRINAIKEIARETFNEFTTIDKAEEWTGLRPSTPKGPPILGKSKYQNLWLNVGHGSLGFTLSAGSATVLSHLITHQSSPIDLNGLELE